MCLNLDLIAVSDSELPALELSIVKYGVSKYYDDSQFRDHCPLGYSFYEHLKIHAQFS